MKVEEGASFIIEIMRESAGELFLVERYYANDPGEAKRHARNLVEKRARLSEGNIHSNSYSATVTPVWRVTCG